MRKPERRVTMLDRLLQQRQRQLHRPVIPRRNRFFQNQGLEIQLLTPGLNRWDVSRYSVCIC